MKKVHAVVPMAIVGLLLACTIPAGAITKSQVRTAALSISDMPTGWSVNHSKSSSTSNCSTKHVAAHDVQVSVSFQMGNVPVMAEVVEGGPSAAVSFRNALQRLNDCTTLTVSGGGTNLSGGGGAMSFPATTGAKTKAYAFNLMDKGITLGFDLVLFDAGNYAGLVTLGDLGTPDTTLLQYFVSAAIDKAEGKPLPAAPSS